MDRLFPILKALFVSLWRDRRSLGSFAANNFFVTVVYFLGMGSLFFVALLACLLLFPLSTDPLENIPADRLALWPLTGRDRWVLRIVTPWMNPITWLVSVLLYWSARHHGGLKLWFSALGAAAIALLVSFLPGGRRRIAFRCIPGFPGRMGQLIRKDFRQLLSTLDFYFAVAISVSCWGYDFFVTVLPPEAKLIFTLLVVLALSTFAQSLFGFDGDNGTTRYQLLPLPGWQILLSKALPFLSAVALLTTPFMLQPGLAAAFTALAVGQFACVYRQRTQRRWRFTAGTMTINSLLQVPLLIAAGVSTSRLTQWTVLPCILLYICSVAWLGRAFDHRLREA